MNVLIIDDDDDVRRGYVAVLQHAGFQVTGVADAAAARASLQEQAFQAIECDVILPGQEGTSFFEELRDTYPALAGRVVFVTGWGSDEKVRNLLTYTGRPFLTKPVELDDLVNTVQQVAGGAGEPGESPA